MILAQIFQLKFSDVWKAYGKYLGGLKSLGMEKKKKKSQEMKDLRPVKMVTFRKIKA